MNTTLELTSPETGLSIPNKPVEVDQLDTAKPLVDICQEFAERYAANIQAAKERVAIQAAADAEMKKVAALRLAEFTKSDAAPAAKEREAKRAAVAPDRAKLTALVRTIRGMDIPSFSNRDLQVGVNIKIEDLAIWIESRIDSELL